MAKLSRDEETLGKKAEIFAENYLRKKGYVVRETNWRASQSHKEIDIVAQDGQTIVFVEVKARKPDGGDPLDAITKKKIRNMVGSARAYFSGLDIEYEYRFDVISVVGTGEEDFQLEHVIDAFYPPLTRR